MSKNTLCCPPGRLPGREDAWGRWFPRLSILPEGFDGGEGAQEPRDGKINYFPRMGILPGGFDGGAPSGAIGGSPGCSREPRDGGK